MCPSDYQNFLETNSKKVSNQTRLLFYFSCLYIQVKNYNIKLKRKRTRKSDGRFWFWCWNYFRRKYSSLSSLWGSLTNVPASLYCLCHCLRTSKGSQMDVWLRFEVLNWTFDEFICVGCSGFSYFREKF